MKSKIFEQLKDKCKSFGLTKKALEDLAEAGVAGLSDEATEEEIAAKADSLVPFAKAMQGEITRKTRKASSAKPSDDEGNGEGEDGAPKLPDWFIPFQKKMDELESENASLKAERDASARAAAIADKAAKLGIPEFMVKRLNISAEADIDAELSSFKQELVSNSLMPKGQAHEAGMDMVKAKADADAWASSLPG